MLQGTTHAAVIEYISGQDLIFYIVMITIFLSILAHNMSAVPLTNWYTQRITQLEKEGFAQAETIYVPGMPTRRSTPFGVSTPSSAHRATDAGLQNRAPLMQNGMKYCSQFSKTG